MTSSHDVNAYSYGVEFDDEERPREVFSSDSSSDYATSPRPSRFQAKKKKSVKAWKTARNNLLYASIASMVVPSRTLCKMCGEKEANISCKQCGLQAYFCEQCCHLLHTNINIFHTPVVQVV